MCKETKDKYKNRKFKIKKLSDEYALGFLLGNLYGAGFLDDKN